VHSIAAAQGFEDLYEALENVVFFLRVDDFTELAVLFLEEKEEEAEEADDEKEQKYVWCNV